MPECLYDQARSMYMQQASTRLSVDPDPREAILAVHAFLRRCRDYARDMQIPERVERFHTHPTPEHAAKLYQWASWIAFVEHALREIEEGTLDGWFMSPLPPEQPAAQAQEP